MKLPLRRFVSLFLAAAALFLAGAPAVRASDIGNAPALAQDAACALGDLFAFLDPNDNSKVVLIGAFHGFLVPGKVADLAVFDPNVRYRFEIYNDHVNLPSPFASSTATSAQQKAFLSHVKPSRTIDLTFSKREVGPDPQSNAANGNPIPESLRRPKPQIATVTLTGFTGARDKGIYPGILVSPFGVSATATPLQVYEIPEIIGEEGIRVFAGEVDNPFFFDEVAFNNFVDSFRNGSPPDPTKFNRARDTFAGYNTLAIAVRVPVAWLKGANGNVIGIDLLAQRHATQAWTVDGPKAMGAFKTVDRLGNPEVNSFFIPFDQRNLYNASTVKDDVAQKFAPLIAETLTELGLSATEPAYATFINLFVAYGDLLRLDTSVANTGTNTQAAFPNGRRVADDAIDTVLTLMNHGNTLTDNIPSNEFAIPVSFPFLALPHQPLFTTSTDDGTRN
jgi:hypothetical protein